MRRHVTRETIGYLRMLGVGNKRMYYARSFYNYHRGRLFQIPVNPLHCDNNPIQLQRLCT